MESKDILKNVVDLSMSSVEVSVSTAHILSGTREVQGAATSMASAVEELAASIAEIESAAKRSATSVQESTELTHEGISDLQALSRDIISAGNVFEVVSVRTQDLQQVVGSLEKVVEIISKIAGQTNLLALNATIEAARAGEHGKGFAVVAHEVKDLSKQTTDATRTIRDQISHLTGSFQEVLTSVSAAQSTVKNIIHNTEKVSAEFSQINEKSSVISQSVTELAGIISQQKMAVQLLAENMSVVKEKGNENLQAVDRLADQTDAGVKMIEDWRTRLAAEDIDHKVIYLAQTDHLLWKKRLLDMAVGRSSMKSSDLTDHTLCRLGKWYYSADAEIFRRNTSFADIESPHKKVHYHGIEAAKCFERNDITAGMKHYEMVEAASAEVIDKLKLLAR